MRSFLLVWFLIWGTQSFSQYANIQFQNITTKDGLSHADVTAVFQDHMGFIWIATAAGLDKYDGYSLTNYHYNAADEHSISSNSIYTIFEDSRNELWIVTYKGLCRFDRNTNRFVRIPNQIDGKQTNELLILSTVQDTQGRIWAGTHLNGILLFDIETEKFSAPIPSHSKVGITNLVLDAKGDIWFHCRDYFLDGLYRMNTDKLTLKVFNTTSKSIKLREISVNRLLATPDGKLVIGYDQLGFDICNLKSGAVEHYESTPTGDGLLNNSISGFALTQTNELIVGTEDGLSIFNQKTKKFNNYKKTDSSRSLLSNSVQSVYVSNEGSLWVGCRGGGLSIYDKRLFKFKHFSAAQGALSGLSGNSVTCFSEDADKNIWIGTDGGGISRFDPMNSTFQSYLSTPDDPNSLTNSKVLAIGVDKDNMLWAGMWAGGLNQFKITTDGIELIKRFQPISDEIPESNSVFKIVPSIHDRLFVGVFGKGGFLYDAENGKFEQFGTTDTVDSHFRRTIIQDAIVDRAGNEWYASQIDGLYYIDGKTRKSTLYTTKQEPGKGVANTSVNVVLEDSKKRLWLGVNEGGLNLYNRKAKTFQYFTTTDGLPDNTIVGLLEDSKGNLWASTFNGLSKITVTESNDSVRISCMNFNMFDGLQANAFNRWSYFKSSAGEMYFGGTNGFNVFHPDSIFFNLDAPKIVFTGFNLFNKCVIAGVEGSPLVRDIAETKSISLDHTQSMFSVQFTALNFIRSAENRYMYKMEGFDKDWIDAGTSREATYTNLDPGRYTFSVRASNNDGVWNNEGIQLEFIILPPWWETWWFRLIILSIILGLSVSFYFWRVLNLEKQKKVLETKVEERTLELSQANSTLSLNQKEIFEQRDKLFHANSDLEKQKEKIQEQKESIEGALDNLKLLSDFGKRITSELDIQELEMVVYQSLSKMMDTKAFGIGYYLPQVQKLRFNQFIEEGKLLPSFEKNIDDPENLSARCFRTGEMIKKTEPNPEYEAYLKRLPEMEGRSVPLSAVYIPLTVEKRPLGVLVVNAHSYNAYSQADIINLETLATYISVAIDNAQAYRTIHTKSEAISASIRYARTIQNAILPSTVDLKSAFDSFILFKPRDVVSGDFYWYQEVQRPDRKYYFIAAVDCTGHGVPGAFMSLISSMLIKEEVLQNDRYEPSEVLDSLNLSVQKTLKQGETNNHDGFDICLCRFEIGESDQIENLKFAGAKRSLWVYRAETAQIELIDADRFYIGRSKRNKVVKFTQHDVPVGPHDVLYLSSDGIVDQNNAERVKFGTPRLIKLLEEIGHLTMEEQRSIVDKHLAEFVATEKQRDDITLIGIRNHKM